MLLKNIFSLNGRKKGLILGVIIALILSGFSFAQAFDSSRLQWTPGISGKLLSGEALTYRGYSVEVAMFPAPVESQKYKPEPEEPVEPFVGLNISKDGRFISTAVLRLQESYITPDGELKVTAKELPDKNAREWLYESYAPWAIIDLEPRGIPHLAVSVQTDKDKYTSSPDTDIVATVKLENTGSADAVNIDLLIETGLPIKKGSSKYHYDLITAGGSVTETITLQAPVLTEQKTYSISAKVGGYDVKDIPYTANSLKSISIAAEIPVSLTIRKSTVDKMYLKDYTIISLNVKNDGRYDAKDVIITDSLPDSFKLLGNQSLRWVVDIPAVGYWEYRYLVRPQEANKEGVVFPAATAEFTFNNELLTVRSNQPKVVVYGPKIVLKKQTDVSMVNTGDTVTVTVIAENTESTSTRVTVMDTLPDKVTLVSGSTAFEGFLEATRNVSFKYTIRIDSKEPIILPAATAQYYELGSKGRKIGTKSQELEIQIKSAEKIPVSIPTPQITTAAPTPVVTITPKAPTPQITIAIPTPVPVEAPPLLEPLNTVIKLFNKAYNFLNSMLFGEPQTILSIRKSTVDSMYLKDYTSVSLSVKNNGTSDLKTVNIADSLPDGFELIINQSLQWVVDIRAGGLWENRYLVRPQEPNKEGVVFPAATAEFNINSKSYSAQSNQPKIVVLGPKIVLSKKTNVSEVKPGDTMTVTIIAENTGNAPTKLTIKDILPDKVTLVGGSTMYEGVIEANTNVSLNYTLRIDSKEPIILPAATAQYYELDAKGRKIGTKSQELEIQVSVTPSIIEPLNTLYEQLRKAYNFLGSMLFGEPQASLSIMKSTVDSMYLKDYTGVSLSVKNNGTSDLKNVNIADSLPAGFELIINQSLQWAVDIPAGGQWEYRYQVRPQEPNKEGIVFPAATAGFTFNNELHTVRSNQPKIVVLGPKIVLKKQANVSEVRPGDAITVNIIAENTGNAPTKLIINDSLPHDVILAGGSTTYEGTLEANAKVSLNYTIKIDSKKPIKLPPATAQYYELDAKGRKITTKSQEVEIQIKSAEKIKS